MSPAPHPRMHGLTHVTGGPDPIPGLLPPSGATSSTRILDLDRPRSGSSTRIGDVAADSSGIEHEHLIDDGADVDPGWGQPRARRVSRPTSCGDRHGGRHVTASRDSRHPMAAVHG